ncbi:MAG: dihydrofolate reductase family protein, partial [Candidatus Diapherotrites archaeon]|nr:dihydrofolate reductase family protein [Candidatus Diapherotrites archaeon]
IASSLDGFIAEKNGSVKWLDAYQNKNEDYGYKKFYKSSGTLIMGSNTYRKELSFGPWQHSEKKVYVLSRKKPQNVPDKKIVFYSGNLKKLVAKIKSEGGKNSWLVGGSKTLSSFLNNGLIDEAMIFIVPEILNKGIPLFQNISKKPKLELISTKVYKTGIVKLHYLVKN